MTRTDDNCDEAKASCAGKTAAEKDLRQVTGLQQRL